MKRSKSFIGFSIAVMLLITLFAGCASISSFFKGSGKKYDAALVEWEEDKYGDSIYHMILLLQDDPNYAKAKEFVKENFQTAIDKTKGLITAKEAEKADPIEKSYDLYELYQDLYLMVKYAKKITPLTGPKDAWVWEPDLSIDYVDDFEGSRKAAVEIRIEKAKELFAAGEAKEAREMVINTMRIFLYEDKWDTEAETALRKVTATQIAEMAKKAALDMLASDEKEVLEEGLKTLDMALDYSPDDEEVASIRGQIEDKLVESIIAETKELESKGDLESLKSARRTYQSAAKKYSGSKKLQQALQNVNLSIAEEYYNRGYELEQKGDEASIKEALDLYDDGLDYVEGYKKLEDAKSRAQSAIAEIYYQKALALEGGVGKDIQKGKEVIALYETAQKWVDNYKDSADRIDQINQAISVSIYVLAQEGELFRQFEKELHNELHRKLGSGFFIYPATSGDRGFSPAMVNNKGYMDPAKSKGLNYMVLITGEPAPVEEEVEEERKKHKIEFQIEDDGTIQELPDGGLVTLNIGRGAFKGTDKEYLKSMNLRGYGTANFTSIEKVKTIYRYYNLDYQVVNVETGSTVYTGSWRHKFKWSQERILDSALAETDIEDFNTNTLRDWYIKEINELPTRYTKSAPPEAKWQEYFAKNADFVNNKAGDIAGAIKEDRF